MGPSGFQTKGLEYRDVVASLFFLLLALCHVLCYTGTFSAYCEGISRRCLYCSVALFCIIFLLDQLVFQLDISRTVMAFPKFLVFQARWNNENR